MTSALVIKQKWRLQTELIGADILATDPRRNVPPDDGFLRDGNRRRRRLQCS